tara:strand:- start:2087 stop:4714 length:2628 start_codon:yes stop_codon:yes gene_type:complete
MAVYIQDGGAAGRAAAARAENPGQAMESFASGLQSGNRFVSEFVNREQQLDEIERARRAEALMLEDRAAQAYQNMVADQQAAQAVAGAPGAGGGAMAPGGAYISPEVQAGLNMQAAADQVAAADNLAYVEARTAQGAEKLAARESNQRLETWDADRAVIQDMFSDGIISQEEAAALQDIAPQLAAQYDAHTVTAEGVPRDPTEDLRVAGRQYFDQMNEAEPRTFDPIAKPGGNPMEELGEPGTFLPSPAKVVDFLRTSAKPELANMSPENREAFLQRYRQHYDKVQTRLSGMVLEAQQTALQDRIGRVETMLLQQNNQFTKKRQMAPEAIRSLAEAVAKGDEGMVKSLMSSADANSRSDLNRAVQWAQHGLSVRKYEEVKDARRAASVAINQRDRTKAALQDLVNAGADDAATAPLRQQLAVEEGAVDDTLGAVDAFDPGTRAKFRADERAEVDKKAQLDAVETYELAQNRVDEIDGEVSALESTLQGQQERQKQDLDRVREQYSADITAAEKSNDAVAERAARARLQSELQRTRAAHSSAQVETQNELNRQRQLRSGAEATLEDADVRVRRGTGKVSAARKTRQQREDERATREFKVTTDNLKLKQLQAGLELAQAKAANLGSPESARNKARLEERKLEAQIAKLDAETKAVERKGGGKGGSSEMTTSQLYSARMAVIRQLAPAEIAKQLESHNNQMDTYSKKIIRAEATLTTLLADKSPRNSEVLLARAEKDEAVAGQKRVDAILKKLLTDQGQSMAERLKSRPALASQLRNLDEVAVAYGIEPLLPSSKPAPAPTPAPVDTRGAAGAAQLDKDPLDEAWLNTDSAVREGPVLTKGEESAIRKWNGRRNLNNDGWVLQDGRPLSDAKLATLGL